MPDLKQICIFFSRLVLPAVFIFILPGCTEDPVETDLLLPVDFANVPEDMVLTKFHHDKIEIRIKGRPGRIAKINKEHLVYPADIYTDLAFDPAGGTDAIEPGRYLLPVDKTRIPLGSSVSIISITPSYLSVHLERKITRVFKVNAPLTGEAADGYMALAPVCEPGTVALTGMESLISRIEQLQTKPVDLSHANEDFKKEVPLDLEHPELFTPAQSIFVVSVPVRPRPGTRTIARIPIELRNSPGNKASVEPATISIDLKGSQEDLNNMALTEKIYAFMDLSGLKPGVYARHAYIDIPVELVMINASPRVFTVKIK